MYFTEQLRHKFYWIYVALATKAQIWVTGDTKLKAGYSMTIHDPPFDVRVAVIVFRWCFLWPWTPWIHTHSASFSWCVFLLRVLITYYDCSHNQNRSKYGNPHDRVMNLPKYATLDQIQRLASSCINSSSPSAVYMRQWIWSALVQIMACRLFGAKSLSEPVLGYCYSNP